MKNTNVRFDSNTRRRGVPSWNEIMDTFIWWRKKLQNRMMLLARQEKFLKYVIFFIVAGRWGLMMHGLSGNSAHSNLKLIFNARNVHYRLHFISLEQRFWYLSFLLEVYRDTQISVWLCFAQVLFRLEFSTNGLKKRLFVWKRSDNMTFKYREDSSVGHLTKSISFLCM